MLEFWLAFGVTFTIGMLVKAGKRQSTKAKQQQTAIKHTQSNRNYKRPLNQADEELVTVILPTIRNDK